MNYKQTLSDEQDGDHDLGTIAEIAEPELKRPPMYKVILLNDDYTPMEFVIAIRVLFLDESRKATQITWLCTLKALLL